MQNAQIVFESLQGNGPVNSDSFVLVIGPIDDPLS